MRGGENVAYLLADYDSSTYGTKFFRAISGRSSFPMISYHGKISGNDVYCGLLRFESSSGVRYGTLMLSLSSFSQRYTNTYSDGTVSTGTSTATLAPGYSDLYGYLITDINLAFPYPEWITDSEVYVPVYHDVQDFIDEVYKGAIHYPITYRLTNCTAPDAPSEAVVGDTVSVPFVFPDGYGIVNNENVYVTNNGVIVPSTYSDGVLTFEMPDPN